VKYIKNFSDLKQLTIFVVYMIFVNLYGFKFIKGAFLIKAELMHIALRKLLN